MLKFLSKEEPKEKLKAIIQNLNRTLKTITTVSARLQERIAQLKPDLISYLLWANVGDICKEEENYYRAIDYYHENLNFLNESSLEPETLGDLRADVLSRLGNTYHFLGKYQQAIEYHKQVLQIANALQDQQREAAAYENIGNAYRSLTKYEEALEYHTKCLHLALHIPDKTLEGRAHGNIGIVYNLQGLNSKALKCHQRALEIAQHSEIQEEIGRAYGNLGNVFDSMGEYHKAIECHKLDLKIAQDNHDQEATGNAYGNLGNAYYSLGEYDEAERYHQEHLKIAKNIPDRAGEARAYDNLGLTYHALNRYQKAIDCHKIALEIAQEIEDQATQGRAYNNLGEVYDSLGEGQKAINECYWRALQIARNAKDLIGEADVYISYGNTHSSFGEYQKAIEYYEKALNIAIAEDVRNLEIEGKAYINLGDTYRSLGEYDRAREYHEKYLSIITTLEDRDGQARAYENLAIISRYQSRFSEAIENHKKALQIAEPLKDRLLEGSIHGNLGVTYHGQKKYAEAEKEFEASLKLAQEVKNRKSEGRAHGNLGNLYRCFDKYDKAITHLGEALKIAQETGERIEEGRAYSHLGLAYEELTDFSQAEDNFRKGIKKFNEIQNELGNNYQRRITIFEEQAYVYMGLERALLKQIKEEKKKEALEVTDARRSRALADVLSKKVNSLIKEPIPLKSQAMQDLARKLKTTIITYSFSSLFKDETRIDICVIPSDGDIKWESIFVHNIQEDMKEVAKVFQKYPFISAPPTVRPPRNRSVTRSLGEQEIPPSLPSLQGMQEIYREDSNAASNEEQLRSFKERLSQWYKAFIFPIEKYLPRDPEQTLTIIPDSFLSQIPFAAFRDKGGNYLIEKCAISIAPSIMVLQLLDQLPRDFPASSLIVANPTTPNVSDNNLLGTEKEANIVKEILTTPPEKVLKQEKPTVHRVLEELPKARWIHLACHGLPGDKPGEKLNPHSVFEGVLKLAKDPEDLDRPNGFLYAQEIAALSLRAELVFMSACFSGKGKLQQEGSVGNNWCLLAAGARSTVSTYWRIPVNELTESIIDTFYRHLLGKEREKLSGAQALRQAMLSVIKKDRENLPQVWAAFFHSGLSEVEVKNKA
ncbi:MAG: CHAT domain-containing protein [Verrucomicrobia bacterium]|nr:CHAT domain-containing protein [Verrucomicrobiota bacterium]